MFSMQVYKWNSVDINGENGIHCTRGIVVDKTETGLLVDFDIANKGPQLIAFNRIIHDEDPPALLPCTCRSGSSTNHEVLLQLSVEQPWTWYPAEQLAGSRRSFALVKATVADGHSITDVVRKMHVRCGTCAKRRRAVLFGDYLKEPVDVSYDALAVTSSFRQLWTRKNYLARTYPIGIVDGIRKRFYYMQRRHDEGLDPLFVVKDIQSIMGESTTSNRGLKRPHEDCQNEDTPQYHFRMETDPVTTDIPFAVLQLVLSYVDTIELFRYRRVCPLWDAVITSMDSTTVVICDMSAYGKKDTFAFAIVLFRVIKKTTKYLIFTRRDNVRRGNRIWLRKTLQLTKVLLDQTGITVPTLMLADLEIDNSDFFEHSYSSKDSRTVVSKKLRSICQRLVLVRVTLLNLFEDEECVLLIDKFVPARNLEIPFVNIRTDNITQFELRDALEPSAQQCMKSVDKCEIERLNNWISQANEVVAETGIANVLHYIDQQKIMQVLRIWEADDSRFGPACTWKDVESAQLSNQLDKLHSITVKCVLYKMDARFKEDYSDSDEEEDAEDSDEEEDEEEESADDDENSDDDEEED